MPSKPLKPCANRSCGELTWGTYCEACRKKRAQQSESNRASASARGYNHRWAKYSRAWLARNPLCEYCKANGVTTPATVTDHIIPHKGDQRLFWDPTNHQSLCKSCHDHKTATEDGGFGR